MKLGGGCYCGKVRYEAEGEPMMKAQCHCRECQYITGGSTNLFVLMPIAGFNTPRKPPSNSTRMQGIDLRPALMLLLLAHAPRQQ